jgi:hypothetical protein
MFATELAKSMQNMQTKNNVEKVSDRLKGELDYRFWLKPVADDKVLVKVHASEVERVAFILSDMSNSVLIETYVEDIPAPITQVDPTVPEAPPIPMTPPEQMTDNPSAPQPEAGNAQPAPPKKEAPTGSASTVEPESKEKPVEEPQSTNQAAKTEIVDDNKFNPQDITDSVKKSKVIYDAEKYKQLPGMYLVEPHAKWVFTGRKLALVMGSEYPEYIGKPMLFCGKEVYGVIVLKKIVSNFDFKATRKYHLVTDKERKKWWKDNMVFLYIFEFYPFKFPMAYEKTPGQQTFFGQVDIKEDKAPPTSSGQGPSTAQQARENEVAMDKIQNTPEPERGSKLELAPPPIST